MTKNTDLAEQICSMWLMLTDAAIELIHAVESQNRQLFDTIAGDMSATIKSVQSVSEKSDENVYEELVINCKNASYSLEHIKTLVLYNELETQNKLEFEFIPIIRVSYARFYYFSLVFPDEKLMRNFFEHDMSEICANYYIEKSVEEKHFKYDISIIVVGYNKVEYTKKCVDSILENMPRELRYELILYNHGSTDSTREFYASIRSTKQVDMLINGKSSPYSYLVEGKYCLIVSNDVVVTLNAIKNMYDFMEEHERVGWVVPSTSNVPNLQSLPVIYHTMEEMHEFAKINNIKDDKRVEERCRLYNPIAMMNSEYFLSTKGIRGAMYLQFMESLLMFPDDEVSLHFRRNGYKQYLMKNAYCHHYGSVTIKDEKLTGESYLEGRKRFAKRFGVDPWGTGMCYSPELFSKLPCCSGNKILGVNCGLGSNSLKIKETIRESTGNTDIILHNATNIKAYFEDLGGISDKVFYFLNGDGLLRDINVIYDFIIIEDGISSIKISWKFIAALEKRLSQGGFFIIKLNQDQHGYLLNRRDAQEAGDWLFWKKEY